MDTKVLLDQITNFYLKSAEFNGIPFDDISNEFEEKKRTLRQLLEEGFIVLNFGDRHPNPHILALEPENAESQIKKIESLQFEEPKYEVFGSFKMQTNTTSCCIYPSKKHLLSVVRKSDYEDRPYTLLLALGEPQLSYRAFNLRVLEFYKNDPRFSYQTDDIHGSISAKDGVGLSDEDNTFLETFGFAYDKQFKNRYVAVYITYLSRLTPEHQKRWRLDEYAGPTFLHPDYARASAGHWDIQESIFNAFCEEISIINQMSEKIIGKPLFNVAYDRTTKPKHFGFLIRPTKMEYQKFVHLLDKMIADNINKKFFDGLVDRFIQEQVGGEIIKKERGTLSMLREWLDKSVRFHDPTPKDEMLRIFKAVRKERQPEAHAIGEDEWNQSLSSKQRELIIEAYGAMRTLRLILTNHPKSKFVEVPEWLFKGEITTY